MQTLGSSSVSRRSFATLASGGALAFLLTACSTGNRANSGGAGSSGSSGGRLSIITSTVVYAELARVIAGDRAGVSAIIPANQDPHSYESAAKDKLAVNRADIVIVNGGGYDQFLSDLAQETGKKNALVDVSAVAQLAPPAGSDANEHFWYSFTAMKKAGAALEQVLSSQDSAHAKDYAARRAQWDATMDSLSSRVNELRPLVQGKAVIMTEPVPGYLFDAIGLKDATDPRLTSAVENDTDIPPLVLADARAAIRATSIALLAFNSQTASPQTQQLVSEANSAGVPVVSLTETMPAGQDYTTWMTSNLESVEKALKNAQ
jgi:zinc/manganese transport system substrate-binding protein